MVWQDLKPRAILTKGAFLNAAAVVLAVSGSINCIKHLQAIAQEASVDVNVYELFETLADRVPILSAVMPIGKDTIEQFEDAGGARGVMKQLESMLDTAATTVTGRTVAENLAGVKVADPEVIRPLQRPFAGKPGIVILRGNLAPEGAIVKIGLRGEGRPLKFRGKANVFENSPDAEAALKAGRSRKVTPSCCAVRVFAAVPAWAVPRALCSRSTARASDRMSRSSPTDNCPVL